MRHKWYVRRAIWFALFLMVVFMAAQVEARGGRGGSRCGWRFEGLRGTAPTCRFSHRNDNDTRR